MQRSLNYFDQQTNIEFNKKRKTTNNIHKDVATLIIKIKTVAILTAIKEIC